MDVYPTSPQGGESANIDYVCVDVCIWYENSGLDHRITWRPLIFCYRTKDIYTLLWARPWSLYRFNKFGMGKCSWACFVSSQGKEETGYCVFYFYVCPHLENGGEHYYSKFNTISFSYWLKQGLFTWYHNTFKAEYNQLTASETAYVTFVSYDLNVWLNMPVS